MLETHESVNTPLIFADASVYLEFLPVMESNMHFLGPLASPPDEADAEADWLSVHPAVWLSVPVSWTHQDTPHSLSQAGGSRQIPAPEPP